jgi:hypothetical protein
VPPGRSTSGRCTPRSPGWSGTGHALFAITEDGRRELRHWYASPVDRANPPRNELAIKLAMAVGSPGVDVRAVIQAQRTHTIRAMQDYTRLKGQALEAVTRGESPPDRDDVAWQLVLEQLIFQAEAEARWLDHCETRLVRLAPQAAAAEDSQAPAGGPADQDAPADGDRPQGTAQDGGLRGALRRSRSRR